MTPQEILSHIRNIPDFPKKGILFKDITAALNKPAVFAAMIDNLSDLVRTLDIDVIAAVESRGYLIGAPLAYKLKKGLVIIRKPGKLPAKTLHEEYALEYGTDALEMHEDAIKENEKVLIVDDLLATGGTVSAAERLIKKAKGEVKGALFLLELTEFSAAQKLNMPIYSLLKC